MYWGGGGLLRTLVLRLRLLLRRILSPSSQAPSAAPAFVHPPLPAARAAFGSCAAAALPTFGAFGSAD
eukprot:gene19447-biopygen19044